MEVGLCRNSLNFSLEKRTKIRQMGDAQSVGRRVGFFFPWPIYRREIDLCRHLLPSGGEAG